MTSPAKPEPKARALMGNSEASNAEGAKMQAGHDENERASEQDNFGDGTSSAAIGRRYEDEVSESSELQRPTEPQPPAELRPRAEPPQAEPPQAEPPRAEPPRAEPLQANEPMAQPRPKRASTKPRARSRSGIEPNNVRKLRQEAMMSKAELARRAGVSPLTIDRVEAGCPCRMDTKRKILEALGLKPSARTEVWPDIDAQS
jgi:DNA-binding XRE family transcriptional regulator